MFGYFFGQKGNGLSTRLNRPQSQPLPASPPTPLRMERGVICEATPIGLLKEGEGMPDGRRESYEAVPRRPEQQGTKGPALSMSPVFSVHLLPYLNHTLSLSQPSVTPRTCSSVTLSFSYPVPYPPYPVPLSSLPCPYPVTKKVKPYSFTFFFFPLLSLLMRSRAVITKTYFVCPP